MLALGGVPPALSYQCVIPACCQFKISILSLLKKNINANRNRKAHIKGWGGVVGVVLNKKKKH